MAGLRDFFIMIFLLMSLMLSAQQVDTVYHKKHFNFIRYYPSGSARVLDYPEGNDRKVLCFGNYTDSLMNGEWIYFYPTGMVLARGNYKNGLKRGKWRYYSSSVEEIVIYKKGAIATDMIIFDNEGYPQVIDKIYHAKTNSYTELINGRQKPMSRVHFLD
jgi:antitoxin component YwqK of YwqJK toxin-antitoxin module